MPKISKDKRDKISEHILYYLFSISPDSKFTSDIAKEIARDEEFTKSLLNDLKKNSLVICIDKNPLGIKYEKRQRWMISSKAYSVYQSYQSRNSKINTF